MVIVKEILPLFVVVTEYQSSRSSFPLYAYPICPVIDEFSGKGVADPNVSFATGSFDWIGSVKLLESKKVTLAASITIPYDVDLDECGFNFNLPEELKDV